MTSMKFALATYDGTALFDDHFGQAPLYALITVSADRATLDGTVANPSSGEHDHGENHGSKAGGIGMLLKSQGVVGIAGRAFGGNIVPMRRNFTVALVKGDTVQEAMSALTQAYDALVANYQQGPDRSHLSLR